MPDRNSLHRFYCEGPLERGRVIDLSTHATEQIRRVLRLRPDDRVIVFDGSGVEALASIRSLGREGATIEIAETPVPGRTATPPDIQLGQALLKADRFEIVVQKAAELGVSSIVPLETERCVVSLSADRARSRLERWRRIATEALEQSRRADLVHIEPPTRLCETLQSMVADRRFIAWEREDARSIVSRIDGTESSVAILIGPEGGFTEAEIRDAEAAGFEPVSLGNLTLRSETAAIAAVSMIRAAVEARRSTRLSVD